MKCLRKKIANNRTVIECNKNRVNAGHDYWDWSGRRYRTKRVRERRVSGECKRAVKEVCEECDGSQRRSRVDATKTQVEFEQSLRGMTGAPVETTKGMYCSRTDAVHTGYRNFAGSCRAHHPFVAVFGGRRRPAVDKTRGRRTFDLPRIERVDRSWVSKPSVINTSVFRGESNGDFRRCFFARKKPYTPLQRARADDTFFRPCTKRRVVSRDASESYYSIVFFLFISLASI